MHAKGSDTGSGAVRARIPSVDEGPRPLWSVMIPTHNCAAFAATTLESVLAQDEGPVRMQIQVVDDHSSDDVAEVVTEVGRGRVEFFRQPSNLGQARNSTTCILRARGHLVHLLHGDDVVRPGFYEKLARPFEAHPGLGAAFCGYVFVDEKGRWDGLSGRVQDDPGVLEGWLERLAVQNQAPPSATVVRRSAYEQLGGFDELLGAVDWEMWMRIAARYPVWYEPEPLVLYRRHAASVSGGPRPTGAHIADLRRVIDANSRLLPVATRDKITAEALDRTAIIALGRAHWALRRGDTASWREHWVEALRTSHSKAVVARAAYYALAGARTFFLRRRGRL